MLNGHGDDIYQYERKITSNFSSNIYSKLDLSALQTHLCSQLDLIHSYPEPDACSLAQLLSEKHCVSLDNICVTNGATEAIYLIAQATRESRTSIIIPTFSEYEDACHIHNHTLSFYKKLDEIPSQTEVVWICNPNNPDGFVHDIEYLKEVVKQHVNTIFVFDQSYGYFTNKRIWDIETAAEYKNIVLLHSMTKQYGVPGLRLGYITAHKDVITKIKKLRMPWSVNGLAIEAGKFLVKNNSESLDIRNYLKETKRLQDAIHSIERITTFPTDTHFFLCQLENKKASALKLWLIENYGILIRDASNFRGLDQYHFRIATQSPDENNRLINALQEWI